MKSRSTHQITSSLYWIITIILLILQLIYLLNSNTQIRYEELAESVRNVYWLSQGLIYDGVSSSIGWYSVLLIFYKVFGFGLQSAKVFRFLLATISLLSLAILLKKHLGYKTAILVLVVIGLSPTILFYTTLQAQFGIEFQYLPIIILLLTTINFKRSNIALVQQAFIFLLIIIGATTYPTFIFYIPTLIGVYFYQLKKYRILHNKKELQKSISISLSALIVPLILATLFIRNSAILWHDERLQSGIFRGAGRFQINLEDFWRNTTQFFSDLFIKGDSYYYEIPQPDFSNVYPIIPIVLSIILILKTPKLRGNWILKIVFFSSILNLLVLGFTLDPSNNPGLRRGTPLLTALYVCFIVGWKYLSEIEMKGKIIKLLTIIIFLTLPLHHILAYLPNLVSFKNPSPYQYQLWFGQEQTPSKSFSVFADTLLKQDLFLACSNNLGETIQCRYNEIYPALAGYCEWNNLPCQGIFGYNDQLKKYIPLSLELWRRYYWKN